ncbi:MAG: decaprenyl-phosphate phosphoribosyltransferase [Nocardioides sp.]
MPAVPRSPGPHLSAGVLLLALRPRQWAKNLLVVAAPVAAGVVLEPQVVIRTLAAFTIFCLAASGGYLVNDVVDVRADRAHPVKMQRPVASGALSTRSALGSAVVLLVGALGLSVAVSTSFFVVMVVYVALQLAYCFGLKREPVVELGIVSSGFVLRAIAGGAANHVPLSNWFLMAARFGSLFMVSGKRYAEACMVARSDSPIRPVLSRYTASYLRFVWTVAAGMLIMTCSLWAFAAHERGDNNTWALVSIVPFVFAVLRYAVNVDAAETGEPEDVVLHDRVLLVTGAVWAAAFLLSVYA